jgi:5S rRNA maturation endonuclease (ribonuclease M5)
VDHKPGKTVVFCHAGCETPDVLAAATPPLTSADLFDSPKAAGKHQGRGPCVGRWDYEESAGKVRFQERRYQHPGSPKKEFQPFRPDGKGGWIGDLHGVERIPFRLPELKASSPDELVFIFEGEGKADKARAHLGITATCSCGGTGGFAQWRLPAFQKAMKGRNVIILPDNDAPGAKYAEAVAAAIAGVAKSVKIVRLPLKETGDDVVEWIEAGGTREQLDALVAAAPPWTPQMSAAATETPAEPLTVCLAGIAPEKVTWLWTGRLAVGKITVLDGLPGSGKSTMTCDAAARVSCGLAFPNDRHARPTGGVIFVAGEDGVADTVVPRLLAAGADLARCFVWPADALPYLPDGAKAIEREIQQRQARLLILDPVTALFARDLSTNSDQDVRLALTPLAVAAERLGCCVLMLRHLNKRSGASALDRGGGSVGIGALARVVLLVARDHSDPDLRILATVKANLTRPPRSLQARILDVDGVGKIAYGEECDVTADSLVVEPTAERKGKAGDAVDWIRRTLADGQWHRQREVEATAKEEGITQHTLRRARESAGVTCRQREGGWWWRLPDAQPAPIGQVDLWAPGECVASDGQVRINNNSRLGVPDSQASISTLTPPDGHLTDVPLTDGFEPPKDTL